MSTAKPILSLVAKVEFLRTSFPLVRFPRIDGTGKTVLLVTRRSAIAVMIRREIEDLMPGITLVTAPTSEAAAMYAQRYPISLVIAEPNLSLRPLTDVLESQAQRPDVVVLGESETEILGIAHSMVFEIAARRTIAPIRETPDAIAHVGADLRNDLNNPLQAILMSIYIANNKESAPETAQALDAIGKAANSMAAVVRGLESRLRRAIKRAA